MANLDPAPKGKYLTPIPDDVMLGVKVFALQNGIKRRSEAIIAVLRAGLGLVSIKGDDDQEGE